MRHLQWIWNLRISYPDIDILLWDDDASGAFRNTKYHPDVCLAFAFRISNMMCVPTGVCFGWNTSPNPWESITWARSILATAFFGRKDLMSTHAKWLDMVKFSSPPEPDVIHSKAIADKLHSGFFTMDDA